MASPRNSFRDALEVFCRHQVEFIVVGGVAAVLNGAPISTFDVDLVHARTPENLARVMGALEELDAQYRDQTGRRLAPAAGLLAGDGHHLLRTKFGPVDLLDVIGHGHAYESLFAESSARSLGAFSVRVLNLDALIRIKEETARAVLAILRRTLRESGG
jgi:hypothetical protein